MTRIVLFFISAVLFTACSNNQTDVGDKQFRNGNYQEAIVAYTEYLRLNPGDVKTLYNRGRAYQEIDKDDKALEDFMAVVKEDPKNVNALLSIANDYFYRLRDYDNAIFFSEKVLTDNPNAMAFTLKGKSYQKLGKINEAMEAYNDALSTNDSYPDAYLSRGSLYIYLKQISKACADFKSANALGSDVEEYVSEYCR